MKSVAARLRTGLESVRHPLLKSVRGRGLWLAAVLSDDRSAQVQQAAAGAGFLVNALQPDAVRIAPPLIVTAEEVDALVSALPAILTEAAA